MSTSDILAFPPGFGNIYLGETFTAYVSAFNSDVTELRRLEIRIELQSGTKRAPLLDHHTQDVIASFGPKAQADFVVEQELKEPGVHIMICIASYLDTNNIEKKVKQYFKFNVHKPLSVTTKLHLLHRSVFLENQIQNVTKAPLFLHAIKFEPHANYIRTDLNDLQPPQGAEEEREQEDEEGSDNLFGLETMLRAGDVRQFLYQLTPKDPLLSPSDKGLEELGRLEMSWKCAMGEAGRLHSLVNLQQWKLAPPQDIIVAPHRVPQAVQLETPFTILLRVLNTSPVPVTLSLHVGLDLTGALVDCGCDNAPFTLPPRGETKVKAELMALVPGLRAVNTHDIALIEEGGARYGLSSAIHLLVSSPQEPPPS